MSEKSATKTTKTPARKAEPVELIEEQLEPLQGGTTTQASKPEFKYVPIRRY